MPTLYMLRITNHGTAVEFLVNGVPAAYLGDGLSGARMFNIRHLLLSGENVLEAVVHANPFAARFREPWSRSAPDAYRGPSKVLVEVVRFENADAIGPVGGEVLLRDEWIGVCETTPENRVLKFRVVDEVPIWSWTQVARLTDHDFQEVTSLVTALHRALTERRLDEIMMRSEPRQRDACLAYGWPFQVMRDGMRDELEAHVRPPFIVQPLEPPKWSVRPLRDRHLVEVTTGNRAPVLVMSNPQTQTGINLPFIVGRLNGEMRLVV